MAPAVHAQSPVTLKIAYPAWDTKAQEAAVTGIFADYEKQNPNVKIELISLPFPVLRQRLVVSARAGDPPDVAYIDGRWVPEMAAPGLLSDITDGAAKLDRVGLVRRTLEGRHRGRPNFRDPGPHRPMDGLLQHRAVPEGGHHLVPEEPGRAGRGRGEDDRRRRLRLGLIGAKDASLISRYINFLYAFHGDLLTPDGKKSAFAQPESVAALKFYTDLMVKHKATQPSAMANGLNDVNQLFMTGRAAMIIDGPWRQGTLREQAPNLKWAVAQLPPAAGKTPRYLTSSWYYTLFKGGRNQDAALKFVDFLLKPENMAKSVVTLPARKSAARDPRFASDAYKPWVEAIPHAVPFTVTDKFTEIADAVGDAVQQVLGGRSDAATAAAAASRKIDSHPGLRRSAARATG